MEKIEGKNVLVTGGAGFIGSHLTEQLLAAGNRVTVLDDFSTGHERNLSTFFPNRHLRIVRADIRSKSKASALLKKIDIVFHLACRNVRLSLTQPSLVHDVNATGTLNMLEAASACRVGLFVYCSSSEVNGTADQVPLPEDYLFRPETVYGASKLVGEYYAKVFHRSGWLKTIVARPHNTYGPREHYDDYKGEVIPRFILLALAGEAPVIYGDGKQTRDFTYVEETADFLIRLAACEKAQGGTFNVCRGEEVSILEIARIICELTGSKTESEHCSPRPSDVLRLCGDASKLRALLGSAPQVSIREGLEKTVAWFRQNVKLTDKRVRTLKSENWKLPKKEWWMRSANP